MHGCKHHFLGQKSGIFLTRIQSFFLLPHPTPKRGQRPSLLETGTGHPVSNISRPSTSGCYPLSSLFLLRCPLPVIPPQRSISWPQGLGRRHVFTHTHIYRTAGGAEHGTSFHRMTQLPAQLTRQPTSFDFL